jgi:hypothetical protein
LSRGVSPLRGGCCLPPRVLSAAAGAGSHCRPLFWCVAVHFCPPWPAPACATKIPLAYKKSAVHRSKQKLLPRTAVLPAWFSSWDRGRTGGVQTGCCRGGRCSIVGWCSIPRVRNPVLGVPWGCVVFCGGSLQGGSAWLKVSLGCAGLCSILLWVPLFLPGGGASGVGCAQWSVQASAFLKR